MKRTLPGLVASIALLVVAFLPPVVIAAERNENIHFGEGLLVLLAGLLLAHAAQSANRDHLALDASPHSGKTSSPRSACFPSWRVRFPPSTRPRTR